MKKSGGKRKSRSDLLNEQIGSEGVAFDPEDFAGNGEAPVAEDFDEADAWGDDGDDATGSVLGRAKKLARREQKGKAVLRRRAPLDESLSSGKYAAEPVDARAISAKVDSLFSMFDGAEDDELDRFDDDDDDGHDDALMGSAGDLSGGEEGSNATEHARNNKMKLSRAKNEDEYAALLERKMKKKYAASGATNVDGDGDDAVMRQIEELRQRQIKIASGAADDDDADGDSSNRAQAEDALRSLVNSLVSASGFLVQMRVKLEGGVSRAVRLPQYYALPAFLTSGGAELSSSYAAASAMLFEIEEDLLRCDASLGTGAAAKKRAGSISALFNDITRFHTRIMKDVDECVAHWGAKVAPAYNPKHTAINRPLLEQIRGVIAGKGRLLARAQRNRLHESVFGHPGHFSASKQERALVVAEGDHDPEIFDDSDFLRELIHRSGALATRLQQAVDTLKAEKRSSSGADAAKPKQGFHHLTKGKAINYEPRAKLVGFMAPIPYATNGMTTNETLFGSLFQ